MLIYHRADYSIHHISIGKNTTLDKKQTLDLIINYYNSSIKDNARVAVLGYSGILRFAISLYDPDLLQEGIVWLELTENT